MHMHYIILFVFFSASLITRSFLRNLSMNKEPTHSTVQEKKFCSEMNLSVTLDSAMLNVDEKNNFTTFPRNMMKFII